MGNHCKIVNMGMAYTDLDFLTVILKNSRRMNYREIKSER